MLSVHLIPGVASVPPLSLALLYKGKRLPNRAIRCAIYATSVVYHVNCRLSTVSKICIQLVYKKFAIWRSFPLPAWLSALSPAARSCLAGTPPSPSGYLPRRFSPCRFRLRRGEARGEAPCIRKLKISPFPGGEGGRGDGGKKASKRRGRQAATKASPPCGHHSGKVSRRPAGQAPKNHSSASSSRKAVTKPRAAASSDASAKIRRRGSVPENRQITKELSAK